MARITAPIEGFRGTVGGVQFKDSVAETDNEAVITYCLSAGYTVELGETEPAGSDVPDASWKVAELVAWATDHEIAIPPEATKKADILAVLVEASATE